MSLFFYGYLYQKEIRENKGTTVCQFIYCKKFPKTTSSYFKYYVNGKEYEQDYWECPKDYGNKIGKYFTINYSKLDPEKITVDFSEEVTDNVKIIDAGFTKE